MSPEFHGFPRFRLSDLPKSPKFGVFGWFPKTQKSNAAVIGISHDVIYAEGTIIMNRMNKIAMKKEGIHFINFILIMKGNMYQIESEGS